jgi:hypothetical protein
LIKAIDALTDLELEEHLKLVEMDVRWNRNHAYALRGLTRLTLMDKVQDQEQLLRKLRDEREHRIINNNYRPFV